MGLAYAWDAVISILKSIKYKKAEYALLGKPIKKKDFCENLFANMHYNA